MALNNPSNLYTAGAVVFDTRPSTNFAIQLLQQKKAKDEALDQYYKKLPSTINEAGMRDQDREPFMQNIGQLQAYWRDNRDKIKNPRKDGGAAQYNYEKMFRDISTRVNMSKQAAKTDLELGKLRFSENTSYIFDDPEIIDRIGKQSLNVWDPQHQTVDLATITVPPKPLGASDWSAFNQQVTRGLEKSKVPLREEKLGGFQVRKHYAEQYTEGDLKLMGNRAESIYSGDRKFKRFADAQFNALVEKPEEYAQYNAVFEPMYKRPMQHPKDLLVAKAVIENNVRNEGYEDKADESARMAAQQAFQRQERLARQQFDKENKGGSATGPVGNVLNTIQVSPEHQSNQWYTMTPAGNKQNMASIQQLLGDKVMDPRVLTGESAKDPKNRVEYKVENGEVKAIRYKGLVYDRDYFERAQKQLDKNPQWEGKLRYPEAQQQAGGMVTPNKGSGKPSGSTSSKKDPAKAVPKDRWRGYSVSVRQEMIKNGYYPQ
jgi:hypothetical protein